MNKKVSYQAFFVVLITIMVGCTKTYNFTLQESADTVVQIDLINNYTGDFQYLYSLSEDEIPGFIESLLTLDVEETCLEPTTNYGELVAHLWYSNGHSELISSAGMCYRTDSSYYDGRSSISYVDLHYLFAQYVDENLLPGHPNLSAQ